MVTIVLKVDMCCCCKGCAKKIMKTTRRFKGVVNTLAATNEITVIGRKVDIDPLKLAEYVALKTKKKVELVSPLPTKQTPKENENPVVKKQEAPDQVMSTVTFKIDKIDLHCDRCIDNIAKFVTGYQGVDKDSFRIDTENNLVRVKGTMDAKELTAYLKQNLKRDVVIVWTSKGDSSKEKDADGSEKRTEGGAAQNFGHPRAGPRYEDGYGHVYGNGYNPNGYGHGYNPNGYGHVYENGYNHDPGYGQLLLFLYLLLPALLLYWLWG
ncbi:hypothetical protein MKW94_014610 [Papaver nudicaule]|uniref:HMA domain-containing protein n=1 Tax=Papaver nudicaule TaxID=74823 RepID=A0AA41RZI3_PAPNU|nr:hypothetical protein [Papaver nudicaule]